MAHVWSENEIEQVAKVRTCRQGREYLIIWKNGDRPTWELRESFNKSTLLDAFERKVERQAKRQFPIYYYTQKYRRKLVSGKVDEPTSERGSYKYLPNAVLLDQGVRPKEIIGVVSVCGVNFALLSYPDETQQDFVPLETLKRMHPKLVRHFISTRQLNGKDFD